MSRIFVAALNEKTFAKKLISIWFRNRVVCLKLQILKHEPAAHGQTWSSAITDFYQPFNGTGEQKSAHCPGDGGPPVMHLVGGFATVKGRVHEPRIDHVPLGGSTNFLAGWGSIHHQVGERSTE